MSNDAKVTKDLLQTLEDGRAGFEKGAEKLDSTDAPVRRPSASTATSGPRSAPSCGAWRSSTATSSTRAGQWPAASTAAG